MSLLTKMAMNALMKTSHPTLERKQCWNLRPHKNRCTACQDVCPHAEDVWTKPSLIKDWEACTDCGLCVAVCKSRCINPSPEQVQRDTAQADSNNDTVWIGCEQSTRKNDMVRPCVGAVSWEALAYLALNKKLVLDLTPCGECENDACAELLRASLSRLYDFLGERLFETRVTLAYAPEDAPYQVKEISRREMFSQVTDSSKMGTRQFLRNLPLLRGDDESAQDFRLMLNQRLKQLKAASATPPRFGWNLPEVNEKCFGCGKCERACKAGALKLTDGADGLTRVVVTPWKCSECGQCVVACMSHAMDGMKLRQVTTLGPVSVHKFEKVLCSECGKPVPKDSPNGICKVCEVRARTKKRQAEAAAKAKERAAKLAEEKAAQEAAAAEKAAENVAAESAAETVAAGLPVAAAVENSSAAETVAGAETAAAAENSSAVETVAGVETTAAGTGV